MSLYQYTPAIRIKEVVFQLVHTAASCCGEKWWPHFSAFWASCLQIFPIRIHLQNASCLLAPLWSLLCLQVSYSSQSSLWISGKKQGIIGNPLELRKAEITTLQSIFQKLTLRIYSLLLSVSVTQSSRHKWHISNAEKVVPEKVDIFFFPLLKIVAVTEIFKIFCTILGSPWMFLVSRCIFL